MDPYNRPPPPPGHELREPEGRGGPNGPPPGMVMGPQGALFGFGGQGGPMQGAPMGYNMMPGMLPQGMPMPGNALAYMPWFPQMGGQMGGMPGYGMQGMLPPGQADGMQGELISPPSPARELCRTGAARRTHAVCVC